MSTITKQQAQKIIEAADEVITALAGTNEDVHPESDNMLRLWDDLNDRHAPPEVVRDLARIALAALEAEPVAYIFKHPAGRLFWSLTDESNRGQSDVMPVYTAPPAPVALTSGYSDFEEIWSSSTHPLTQDDEMKDFALDIWNACRAAMLQSFGNSEQLNSPVIPDGWVACSELMPEQFKAILAFNEYGEVWSGAYDRYWNFYCDNLLVEHVTHWMPLPAAPQQEVTQALAKGMERYGDAMQKLADSGD